MKNVRLAIVMNWQLLIIILYFVITMLIGFLAARKTKSSANFMGAQMGVLAIVCVACGQWLGGTATTGCAEYGFTSGISGWWYTISNGIGMLMMALFFAERYRRYDSVTIPGIIEKLLGVKARTVSSCLLIFVMLAVGLSQMISAGKLGQSLLGIDFTLSCCIFAVIFIAYTMSGGMDSVSATNKLHLVIMYGGMILAVFLAVRAAGGWSGMKESLDAIDAVEGSNHFSMSGVGIDKVSSWILASVLSAGAAQASIQPVLAARDPKTAKKACLISVFVVAPFGLFSCLLGMASRVLSEQGLLLNLSGVNVTDPKLAFTTLIMNFSPVVSGIILASILAAILSTISPIILASATMFTKDLYQRRMKPDASDKEIVFMSRLTTALSGVVCCLAAIALVNASAVLDLVYAAYTLRGVLFIVLLFGIYWKHTSGKGACVAMLFTFAVCLVWVAAKLITGSYPLVIGRFAVSETYVGVVVATVSLLVFSRIWPRTDTAA